MEWTDTQMLRTTEPYVALHHRIPRTTMEVRVAQGVSLIRANLATHTEATEALETLRSFRAAGRRVVLCDTSAIAAGRQLGQSIVSEGQARVLVSCGMAGREVAVGARDTGLDLANVVVCRDSRSACELLAYQLAPGDTVLLMGVDKKVCDHLVDLLDRRDSPCLTHVA
jgi:hypothetical protein